MLVGYLHFLYEKYIYTTLLLILIDFYAEFHELFIYVGY